MTREWKPGDVAMVPFAAGPERGMWLGDHWVVTGGRASSANYSVNPLVVIDPEDREQVERLHAALSETCQVARRNAHTGHDVIEHVQAALREFANPTPPKPDEPLGLGAVVVDHREMKFVRCADGWLFAGADDGRPPGEHRNPLTWADLSIVSVRVLSDGVQP